MRNAKAAPHAPPFCARFYTQAGAGVNRKFYGKCNPSSKIGKWYFIT
jgi:hypothetical protein